MIFCRLSFMEIQTKPYAMKKLTVILMITFFTFQMVFPFFSVLYLVSIHPLSLTLRAIVVEAGSEINKSKMEI